MMKKQRIVFGNDHGGAHLKAHLLHWAQTQGHAVLDLGVGPVEVADYPDQAQSVCQALIQGEADYGVLICGSGIGMSIAANRFPAIRAALCNHHLMAKLSRGHNDANVLVLGERLTGADVAQDCLDVFLKTPFEGGRHASRVSKMSTQG